MDLEPIPRPRTKRAMNKLTHELATPSQIDATNDQMSVGGEGVTSGNETGEKDDSSSTHEGV